MKNAPDIIYSYSAPQAADTSNLPPELLSVKEAARIFALSQSRIYKLIAENAIATIHLRERGMVKGRRLIVYQDLKAYLMQYYVEASAGEKNPNLN